MPGQQQGSELPSLAANSSLQDVLRFIACLEAATKDQLWSMLDSNACHDSTLVLQQVLALQSSNSKQMVQQLLDKHDLTAKLASIVAAALQQLQPQQLSHSTVTAAESLHALCACLCSCTVLQQGRPDWRPKVAQKLLPKSKSKNRGLLVPVLEETMPVLTAALQQQRQPSNTLWVLSSCLLALWHMLVQLATPSQLFTLDLAVLPAAGLAVAVLSSKAPDSSSPQPDSSSSSSGGPARQPYIAAASAALESAHHLALAVADTEPVAPLAGCGPEQQARQQRQQRSASPAGAFLGSQQVLPLLLANLAAVAAALHAEQEGLSPIGAAPPAASSSSSSKQVSKGSVHVPDFHLETLPDAHLILSEQLQSILTENSSVQAAVRAGFAALQAQQPNERIPIAVRYGGSSSYSSNQSTAGVLAADEPAQLVRLLCEVMALRPERTFLIGCLAFFHDTWKHGMAKALNTEIAMPSGASMIDVQAAMFARSRQFAAKMAEDLAAPVLLLLAPAVLWALERPATDDPFWPSSKGQPPNTEQTLMGSLTRCLAELLVTDDEQHLLPVFAQEPLLMATALQGMLRSYHKEESTGGGCKLQTFGYLLASIPLKQHAELAAVVAAGGGHARGLVRELSGLLIASLKCAAAAPLEPTRGSRWDAILTTVAAAQTCMAVLGGAASLDADQGGGSSSNKKGKSNAVAHVQPQFVAVVARSLFVLGQLISQMHANPAAAAGGPAVLPNGLPSPRLIGGAARDAHHVPHTCITVVQWLGEQLAAVAPASRLEQLQEQQRTLQQALDAAQQAWPAAARAPSNALQVVSRAFSKELVSQLQEFGATVGAQVPSAPGCHYLGCCNLEGLSEADCASKACPKCKGARFCSQACLTAQWKQHRPVCKQLRASAGGGSKQE